MYLQKRRSLYITFNFVTYQGKAEEKALIDSGATGNFIDQDTIRRLKLGTFQLANPRQVFNVDGLLNKAGTLKEAIHLYMKLGREEK